MLVYALKGTDVAHVFVDGVQRVKKGKVLGADTKKLVKKANALATELAKL
jgi:cytosine/adenosine deaminase-related metal-dependent hydrolase